MKTNEYLYGKEVEVPEIPQEIIVRRVELLQEHLDELLEVNYRQRDTGRCKAVFEAIKFWEGLNNDN